MKIEKIEGKEGNNNGWCVNLNLLSDLETEVCNNLTYDEAKQIYEKIKLNLTEETTKFIEIKNGLTKELVSISKIVSVEMYQ